MCLYVCKQVRHKSSIDCSSALMVIKIALEIFALLYIFRSASRKTVQKGGNPANVVPALPLPLVLLEIKRRDVFVPI